MIRFRFRRFVCALACVLERDGLTDPFLVWGVVDPHGVSGVKQRDGYASSAWTPDGQPRIGEPSQPRDGLPPHAELQRRVATGPIRQDAAS